MKPHKEEQKVKQARREWHGCTDPRGHAFDEGVCKDCGMSLRLAGDDIRRKGNSDAYPG